MNNTTRMPLSGVSRIIMIVTALCLAGMAAPISATAEDWPMLYKTPDRINTGTDGIPDRADVIWKSSLNNGTGPNVLLFRDGR